jgi:hypothetical protein
MSYNKKKFILNTIILLNSEGQIKYIKRFLFKNIITFYKFLNKKGL